MYTYFSLSLSTLKVYMYFSRLLHIYIYTYIYFTSILTVIILLKRYGNFEASGITVR